jgi:hypothetical protein
MTVHVLLQLVILYITNSSGALVLRFVIAGVVVNAPDPIKKEDGLAIIVSCYCPLSKA